MAKRTIYGTMTDTGFPREDGGNHGIVGLSGSVNVTDMGTMPFLIQGQHNESGGEKSDALALNLVGTVLGKGGEPEVLSVVWVMPWVDAGKLAAMLMHAARRSSDEGHNENFGLGFYQEDQKNNDQCDHRSGD